jgi:hypothetical protein
MYRTLSLDAKLIAATNMAIAEAIWQTFYLERGGVPAQSADQMVLKDIRQAMKELDKIAQKFADDEAKKIPDDGRRGLQGQAKSDVNGNR